jgi:hypothetical protein
MEQKPVVTLNEAGFLSAMKRFLFFDQSALEEVRAALSEVRTEYDRQRLLRAIDGFLTEAKSMKKSGVFGDALDGMFAGLLAGSAGSAVGYAVGMNTKIPAPEVGAIKQAVRGAINFGRGMFGRAKVDYSAADMAAAQASFAQGMASAAFKNTAKVVAALAAVVIVLRAINRNGDKIDDYITALTALRAEVVALKLEGHPTLSVQEAVLQLAEAKRVARFLGDACSKASLCEEVAMIAEALCNQQGKALSESQQPIRVRDAFSDAVALHDSLLEEVFRG